MNRFDIYLTLLILGAFLILLGILSNLASEEVCDPPSFTPETPYTFRGTHHVQ